MRNYCCYYWWTMTLMCYICLWPCVRVEQHVWAKWSVRVCSLYVCVQSRVWPQCCESPQVCVCVCVCVRVRVCMWKQERQCVSLTSCFHHSDINNMNPPHTHTHTKSPTRLMYTQIHNTTQHTWWSMRRGQGECVCGLSENRFGQGRVLWSGLTVFMCVWMGR